jgi:hypothetical protein
MRDKYVKDDIKNAHTHLRNMVFDSGRMKFREGSGVVKLLEKITD